MPLPELKVIISGGGTGGHVFPAIAIADALKELDPAIDILFVGALGRMEMEKVPAAGYPIKGLWISGLQRRLTLKNLAFPLKVIHSTMTARSIIRNFAPNVVVGVGGYASGPTLKAASSMGIPTVLQEQNSYPGITNKLLASKANFICVAYENMDKFFPREKIIITGNPVRKDIITGNITREDALAHFGLVPDKPVILSVGGSLGAATLNKSIHSGLEKIQKSGIQVIWQTGKSYEPIALETVATASATNVKPMAFITQMNYAYAAADLIISRAGAIAISELCLRGKPSILVPSPNVAEDHQTHNAMALVASDAAIMVRDSEAARDLVSTAINTISDTARLTSLSTNIAKLAHPNAARQIAELIINCASSKPGKR